MKPQILAKIFLEQHTRTDKRSVYEHTISVVNKTSELCDDLGVKQHIKSMCVEVAWLHDLLEREPKTCTLLNKTQRRYVKKLTSDDSMSRDVYIKKTSSDIVTLIVKIADIKDAIEHGVSEKKKNRHKKELNFLVKVLANKLKKH